MTTTLAGYEELALRLATDTQLLQAVRMKLQSNRLTTPLFDSVTLTRHKMELYGICSDCHAQQQGM